MSHKNRERIIPRQDGISLIEVVMSIVVIAIAASAVLYALSRTSGRSADAMIVSQAASIAEAYMEEVALQPYDDPDGIDGEIARADFDDIDDYDGLTDNGAHDRLGTAIAGLDAYTITVNVTQTAALPNVTSVDAVRIDINVLFDPYVNYTLSAYRTRL